MGRPHLLGGEEMKKVYLALAVLFAVVAFPGKASAQTRYPHYRDIRYLDANGQQVGARITLCNGQTMFSGTVTSIVDDTGFQPCAPIFQKAPVSPGELWYWECIGPNGNPCTGTMDTDPNCVASDDYIYLCSIKFN
jgi:hypothetical protein